MRHKGLKRVNELLGSSFSASMSEVIKRQSRTLDIFIDEAPIVIYGAGYLGRKLAELLRGNGYSVLAFADRDSKKWRQQICGLPTMSPEEAANLYGQSAVFIVSVWTNGDKYVRIKEHLQNSGCEGNKISSILPAMWKFHKHFLPYFCLDLPQNIVANQDKIQRVYELMEEEESRRQFLAHVRLHLLNEIENLPVPTPEYFHTGVFTPLKDEIYVDCGAYVGDTVQKFHDAYQGEYQSIVAFEPDESNFKRLKQLAETLNITQIRMHQNAVWSTDETLYFEAMGNYGSYVDGAIPRTGQESRLLREVQAVSLDSSLQEVPTLIKYDVEGSELDALAGTQRIIKEHSPVLAVCLYHRQSDLWEIPLYIHSLNPSYRFYIRTHGNDGWETVLYAVPNERLTKG